jgi:ubiquinone/menaquinone biosynthesis C-methylase UbiE
MLSEGRQRGVSVPLALADLRRLPLPVRSLGGIGACASLLHLPKAGLPVALTEFARVLDSGHLYLVLKEGEGEGWQTEGRTGLRRYFARYQLSELVSLLEGSGFQVLEHWLDPPGKGQRHRWISMIATVRALR